MLLSFIIKVAEAPHRLDKCLVPTAANLLSLRILSASNKLSEAWILLGTYGKRAAALALLTQQQCIQPGYRTPAQKDRP